jgi:hypothetical protein
VLYDIGVKNGTKKNQNSRLCTTSAIKAGPVSFGLLAASAAFSWRHANCAEV